MSVSMVVANNANHGSYKSHACCKRSGTRGHQLADGVKT